MKDPTVLLLATYADTWKHITPYLTDLRWELGHHDSSPSPGFAVVAHGDSGRRAQQLVLDEGGTAMVLLGCRVFEGREHELERLTIPVFLIWGEDDIVTPVDVAFRLNEIIKTSTLALVPGCGHDLPLQAPDTVGPLIADYLRTQWAGIEHSHAHERIIQLQRKPPETP